MSDPGAPSSSKPTKPTKPQRGKPAPPVIPSSDSDSDSDDLLQEAAASTAAGKRPVDARAQAAPPAKKQSSSLAALLPGGKATSTDVAVARPKLGESVSAKTARFIRSRMDAYRATLEHYVQQDADAFDRKIEMPSWRDAEGRHSSEALRNISELINSNVPFIPYEKFLKMADHENRLAMLGGVPHNGERQSCPFFRKGNRELITFDEVYANLETILKPVIRETDTFALRPFQRVVIGEYLHRYTKEMYASIRRQHDLPVNAYNVGIPPYVRPNIRVVNLGPGNGKTVIGITMAMTELCNPKLWSNLTNTWRESMWAKTSMHGLGLTKGPQLTGQALARVCIAFVPNTLMKQWENTANLVNDAMMAEFNYGFTVWTGLQVLQRKGMGPNGQQCIRKTLKEAHLRSSAENRPILWLVPAKTDSAQQTLREHPEIFYALRLYDEMTTTTEPNRAAPESQPVNILIFQATIQRLQKATSSQTRHPLRIALGNQSFQPDCTKHAGMFHMITIPDWLRYLVGEDMADVMPCGIKRLQLSIRVQSLSGRLQQSDLTIMSIEDLLKAVVTSVGGDNVLRYEERKELIEKCQRLLGTSNEALTEVEAQQGSIHQRLTSAETAVRADLLALPPEVDWSRDGPGMSHEARIEAERVQSKRRAFNATCRMFGKLAESMDPQHPAECPISGDLIPPEHAALFDCCTNIFDGRMKQYLGTRCPFCNQELKRGFLQINQVVSVMDGQKPLPKADSATAELPMIVADEEKLIQAFEGLSTREKAFSGGMKATIETIKTFLTYKPKGARVLLAFATKGNESSSTKQTRASLQGALGDCIDSIESIGGRYTNKVVEAFVKDDDTNKILLINTDDRSLSLEGLDLYNAQLIILDAMAGTYLQPATVVQAIGCIMRPQWETYVPNGLGVVEANINKSGNPAKWLVLLERSEVSGEDEDESVEEPVAPVVEEIDDDDDEGWEQMPDVNMQDALNGQDGEEEWEQIPDDLIDVDAEQARALLGHD